MVTAVEIRDHASFEAWLKGRPNEDAVCIAMRAVCRVAPLVWAGEWHDRKLVSLVVCRQLLTAGIASKSPTKAIDDAARAATTHSDTYLQAVALAANDVTDAAQGVVNTVATIVYASTEASDVPVSAARRALQGVEYIFGRVAGGASAIWNQVREDARALEAGDDLLQRPLWSETVPDWFREADAGMRALWQADPAYDFWLRWWDGVLSGHQIDWALQETVALIPDEVWQQGAEAVAGEIARIVLDRSIENTPNSEEILRDEAGFFFSVPLSTIRPGLFRDAREKVADTVAEIRSKCLGNQFAALMPDLDRLNDFHDRYADNPQRIHDVYERTIRHIDAKIASGELPDNELILDLRQDLDSGAIDIRRSDTEVAKTIKARVSVRLRRLDAGQKARLGEVVARASAEARPELAGELKEDLTVATDEREGGPDRDEGKYRLLSRLARMAKRRKDDAVKLADDASKLDRGAEAVAELADKAPGWWDTFISSLTNLFG